MRIVPEKDLFRILKNVENPCRYVGGEYGSVIKPDAGLKVAVCFPEIYEIGMSNQAIAILYSLINSIESISCERVFVPAEDFDAALRDHSVPLYSLETGTPIKDFDILAFSFGYELLATNVLSVLESSGIPLTISSRTENDPIVIAGGPAITNPLPFAKIFDAVYIGEAENVLPEILIRMLKSKREGGTRSDLFDILLQFSCIWSDEKRHAERTVWMNFGKFGSYRPAFPIPSLRTVQDHGVVEIMRGCPNGCRFCHAGIYYRPFRMKSHAVVSDEVSYLIHNCGYREITLSSLSSADYIGIDMLLRNLNKLYSNRYISFSLPSLHVESFGLNLLSEIAEVRKSGLTFAVETPNSGYQSFLNKQASKEKILSIVKEAKQSGWKIVKFYFMIGLPFSRDYDEISEIEDFILEVYEESKLQINLNIGTFIPKPHTPFQWSFQLTESESSERLSRIKRELKPHIAKISYHSPFLSFLEGVISRGDERVGDLILTAYSKGARFDAWDEKVKKPAWRETLAQAGWDVESELFGQKKPDEPLPWDSVDIGVTKNYLVREFELANDLKTTDPCADDCNHCCGICRNEIQPIGYEPHGIVADEKSADAVPVSKTERVSARNEFLRILFSYSKYGKAAFLPHLSLMTVFERSFLRAGFGLRFTTGFNPKPVLEFAQPLPVSVSSAEEIACIDLIENITCVDFISRVNPVLPDGIRIERASSFSYREGDKKRPSLMSLYIGGIFEIEAEHLDDHAAIEKAFSDSAQCRILENDFPRIRLLHTASEGKRGFFSFLKDSFPDWLTICSVKRISSLARTQTGIPASFFEEIES